MMMMMNKLSLKFSVQLTASDVLTYTLTLGVNGRQI